MEQYDSYPKGSRFVKPQRLSFWGIKWARLRLSGARRLIGFFLDYSKINDLEEKKIMKNTFYVVFLDKNHEFAPCSRD